MSSQCQSCGEILNNSQKVMQHYNETGHSSFYDLSHHSVKPKSSFQRTQSLRKVEAIISGEIKRKSPRSEQAVFAMGLRKIMEKRFNQKFKVRVLKSVRPNPYIELSPNDWRIENMPNELRLQAINILGAVPLNSADVSYGGIQKSSITLHYLEWKKLIEVI